MSKIIFMGTSDSSTKVLEMLIAEYEVIAVVTQPDRPVGRKCVLAPPPAKKVAETYHIPVYQSEKLKDSDELNELMNLNPDLIVTAAFGQLLPESLLKLPKLGAVNVRASLSPKYRGGVPIHQAIIDGEVQTDITTMYMVKRLDTGSIIFQRATDIEGDDNIELMHDKLSLLGTDLLKETLPFIIDGSSESVPQGDSKATLASNISREDECTDWTRSAKEIHNHIRGLPPRPVVYTAMNNKNLKLYQAHVGKGKNREPGEIIEITETVIIVGTGSLDAIASTDTQLFGKKRIFVAQYSSGVQDSLAGTKLV